MTPTVYPPMVEKWRALHMRRSQTIVAVGTASTKLVGPNPHRRGLILSVAGAAASDHVNVTKFVKSADTSTLGIKLTYTCPAGARADITSFSQQTIIGTGMATLIDQVIGGTSLQVGSLISSQTISGHFFLAAGDSVDLRVGQTVAGSTADLMINGSQFGAGGSVTLSVNSPAVLDSGIQLIAGGPPLILWHDVIGDALTEDLFAIADFGTVNVGVWDLFG